MSAVNRLETGAILKSVAALHITIDHNSKKPSVSSQIGALRDLLLGNGKGMIGEYFNQVVEGDIPLVIDTENADVIATLLELLDEVSSTVGGNVRLTISGGAEAHLLAKELGKAGVGVILTRPRPFPGTWSGQHM